MRMRRVWQVVLAPLICTVIVGSAWFYVWLLYDLPSPEKFETHIASSGSASTCAPVSLSEIPDPLRWATKTIDDPRFYARSTSIDLQSLWRAIWFNLWNDDLGRDDALGAVGHRSLNGAGIEFAGRALSSTQVQEPVDLGPGFPPRFEVEWA
jgi:membrane carboxypeptidase/penicillin-binding protein